MFMSSFSIINMLILFFAVVHISGRWKTYFIAVQRREGGEMRWKFTCAQSGCTNDFSAKSSSTTLKYHYQKDHRTIYADLQNARARLLTGGVAPLTQTSIRTSMSTVPSNQAIITATLTWLIADMLPFSLMDSDHFRFLIRLYNPTLILPCAHTIRAALLDHRLMLKERLKTLMDQSYSCGSMTVDSWTSDAGKPFMSIIVMWMDADFNLHQCALDMAPQPYPHTAFAMANLIRKLIFF